VKVYRHYRASRVWMPLVGLSVMGVVFLSVGVVITIHQKDFPWPFLSLPLAAIAVNVWILGRVAYEVRLEGTSIELIALFRHVRVPIGELIRLAPMDAGQGGWFVLQHRNGKAVFDPRLDGMHELVAEIKRQNPAIELRGC
jgi:hypothetical protein